MIHAFFFDADKIMDKVIKIELVECINENPKMIIVDENTSPSLDFSKISLVEELPQEKIKDFVEALSQVVFHDLKESANAPVGYAVLIYMQNNEILVLSCTIIDRAYGLASTFTYEGKFIKHIARFADEPQYRRVLKKYFNINL